MADSLRVAHLTPTYFAPESVIGGGERSVGYVARAVQAAGGFEQCIFAIGPEDKRLLSGETPVRVLRNESASERPMDAFSAALWDELKGFDLVHLHQCLTLFGVYSLAIVRSLGIPAIGTDRGGGAHPLMLRGHGIALLDGVVSLSRYAHSLIAGAFNGPHAVIAGPVDTDRFCPSPEATRDTRMILCVGRIMPHKGFDRVIAALPPGLHLVIAGHVYYEPYYEFLRGMAAGKDVRFVLDPDDDALLGLYRSAGLFVQAATAQDVYGNRSVAPELLGLTTLEALACGLPVVVSDAGSLPELITDSRFGRVFSGEAALRTILDEFSRGLWPDAGAAALARAHVVDAHGMAPIGRRLAAFYRSIALRRGFAA